MEITVWHKSLIMNCLYFTFDKNILTNTVSSLYFYLMEFLLKVVNILTIKILWYGNFLHRYLYKRRDSVLFYIART